MIRVNEHMYLYGDGDGDGDGECQCVCLVVCVYAVHVKMCVNLCDFSWYFALCLRFFSDYTCIL